MEYLMQQIMKYTDFYQCYDCSEKCILKNFVLTVENIYGDIKHHKLTHFQTLEAHLSIKLDYLCNHQDKFSDSFGMVTKNESGSNRI